MSARVPFSPTHISDWFWDLIAQAQQDPERLADCLGHLSNDQLRRFAMEFYEAGGMLGASPYTDFLTSRSEDNVADFGYWVVSQGKDFYAATWQHPETLAVHGAAVNAQEGNLWGIAEGLLYERLGDVYEDDPCWDIHQALEEFDKSGYTTIADYLAAQFPPSP